MPKIPVNAADVKFAADPVQEDIPLHVVIKKSEYGGENRSGYHFGKVQFQIIEPAELAGRVVFENHIPICTGDEDPFYKFGQFTETFKLDKNGTDGEGFDFDDPSLVGSEGTITAINEEYKGQTTPKVARYLLG